MKKSDFNQEERLRMSVSDFMKSEYFLKDCKLSEENVEAILQRVADLLLEGYVIDMGHRQISLIPEKENPPERKERL